MAIYLRSNESFRRRQGWTSISLAPNTGYTKRRRQKRRPTWRHTQFTRKTNNVPADESVETVLDPIPMTAFMIMFQMVAYIYTVCFFTDWETSAVKLLDQMFYFSARVPLFLASVCVWSHQLFKSLWWTLLSYIEAYCPTWVYNSFCHQRMNTVDGIIYFTTTRRNYTLLLEGWIAFLCYVIGFDLVGASVAFLVLILLFFPVLVSCRSRLCRVLLCLALASVCLTPVTVNQEDMMVPILVPAIPKRCLIYIIIFPS